MLAHIGLNLRAFTDFLRRHIGLHGAWADDIEAGRPAERTHGSGSGSEVDSSLKAAVEIRITFRLDEEDRCNVHSCNSYHGNFPWS